MEVSREALAICVTLALAGAVLIGLASTAQATGTVALSLQPDGDSGVHGIVILTEAGDDVNIEVRASGLTFGESYLSGAYTSKSKDCRGGLIRPFSSALITGTAGTITYTVPGPIEKIFSVSVRQGTEPPGKVVACAERPAKIKAPSTGSGGLLPQNEAFSGTTAAIVLGATSVLLLSGLVALRRRLT